MNIREKIGLDCLELDPTSVLAKPENVVADFFFEYCANILRETGLFSSRLFVVTETSVLIADIGSILDSELGLHAAEEIVEELSADSAILGLGIAHALALDSSSGEHFCALADRATIFEKPYYTLVTHFEWRHGNGAGKRADYVLETNKAKFYSDEQMVSPHHKYLFLGESREYVH